MKVLDAPGVGQRRAAIVRPAPRAWARLAGTHTRAFGADPSMRALFPWPGQARAVLWLAAIGLLAAGSGVSSADGAALAFVALRHPGMRRRLRGAGIVAGGAVVVWLLASWVAGSPLTRGSLGPVTAAAVVASLAPAALGAVSGHGARRRLRRARPAGWDWMVSGLCRAGGAKGSGAVLLEGICEAADRAGAVVVTEAVAPELVGYYVGFGFRATAAPCRLPGGVLLAPMARLPRAWEVAGR